MAKRLKLSTPATPKKGCHQEQQTMENSSSKVSTERLKSLSDVPTEMSFETEMPILEKHATTSVTTTNLQPSSEKQSSSAREMEGCYGAREKVESLGIFFETTVHNSNLLHVCCQLNESGGGAKHGKATGKEIKGVEEGRRGGRKREGEREEEGKGTLFFMRKFTCTLYTCMYSVHVQCVPQNINNQLKISSQTNVHVSPPNLNMYHYRSPLKQFY